MQNKIPTAKEKIIKACSWCKSFDKKTGKCGQNRRKNSYKNLMKGVE